MNTRLIYAAFVLIISLWYVKCYDSYQDQEYERRHALHQQQLRHYMLQNRQRLTYKEYVRRNNYMRKMINLHLAANKNKKKLMQCKQTPYWTINGTHPVLKEVKKGRHVVLYMMKNKCYQCWQTLKHLHDWAIWAKKVGQPISIIALMHRKYGKISDRNRKYFPLIQVYNEPKDKDIFKLLKASIKSLFVYDKCGRHQYHISPGYSSMVFPYTRNAIKNAVMHYKTFCGECEPIVLPSNTTELLDEGPPPTEINYSNLVGPVQH